MNKFELATPTDPKWVETILKNFPEFMADHADCERKASAMAMRLVAKCADRHEMLPALIDLAIEELGHFKEVYALMQKRGIPLLAGFIDDPYVNGLLKLLRDGAEERFLDHLLVLGIVESRGAERFGIIADALTEPELKAFYKKLYAAEVKHGNLFIRYAYRYFDEKTAATRLAELAKKEGEIIQNLPWRPSLH